MKKQIATLYSRAIQRIGLISFFILLMLSQPIAQNAPFVSGGASPSPGAAGLGQQGNVPVNLYSGTAQVGVPLLSVKANHIDFSVGLGYNPQGVKVGQLASNTGLGWSLGAGGVITRKVNGLPDDCYRNKETGATNVGYLYNTSVGNPFPPQIVSDICNNKAEIWEGNMDYENDVFFFSFDGYSGQFIFDPDGNVKLFSHDDLKITKILSTTLDPGNEHPLLGFSTPFQGGISQFTITTPDGVKYLFNKREASFSKRVKGSEGATINECDPPINTPGFDFDYQDPDNPAVGYYTAWYLSKITNPFGALEFFFVFGGNEVVTDIQLEQANDNLSNYPSDDYCIPYIDDTPLESYLNSLKVNNYATEIATITPLFSRIDYGYSSPAPYGSIHFIRDNQARSDVYYPQPLPPSYQKAKALKRIEWWTDRKLKEIELNYGYFEYTSWSGEGCTELVYAGTTCPEPDGPLTPCHECPVPCEEIYNEVSTVADWVLAQSKRLRLESVIERGWDENGVLVENPPYEFSYYGNQLPPRITPNQDFWGYYKGGLGPGTLLPTLYAYPDDDVTNEKYQSIYSVFPRDQYQGDEIIISRANRNANSNAMRTGVLSRVDYPTGGFSEFTYSAHQFDLDGQTFTGGGLRIDQVLVSDGDGGDMGRSYSYVDGNGNTSGKLMEYPRFGRYKGCLTECGEYDNIENHLRDYTAVYSGNFTSFGTSYGAAVGYAEVTENRGSNGRIKNVYNLTAYAGVETTDEGYQRGERYFGFPCFAGFCQYDLFPFPQNSNYDWNNGLLKESYSYGADGSLVQKTINTYDWVDFSSITSFKPYVLKYETEANQVVWNVSLGSTKFLSGDKRLTRAATTHYGEFGGQLETITDYEYDVNYKIPKAIETANSDGKVHRTEFSYPHDLAAANPFANHLVFENRIYVPMEVVQKVNGVIRGGTKTEYDFFQINGALRPMPHNAYERGETSWILRNTFETYNDLGFITQSGVPGFNPNTYVWEDGLLKFKNVNVGGTNGTWTYTYGYNAARYLSSVTDFNNQTTTYSYDGLLRQNQVTSKNGAVITTKNYTLGGSAGNTVVTYTDYGSTEANSTETQYNIAYLDGLGRPIRTDALGHSPTGGNLTITSTAYDDQGRAIIVDNYQTGVTTTTFDGSPLGRIRSIGFSTPGTIDYKYFINSSSVGSYPAGSLFKTEVRDENNNPATVFTDIIGRKVAERNALDGWTHYEYDDYDRLTKVIPPGSVANNSSMNYSYDYDERHRLITKNIPGAQYIEYVYNDRDEAVLMQDGKLRAENRWLCFQYDDFSRTTATGFYSGPAIPNPTPQAPLLTSSTYDVGVGASVGKLTESTALVLNPDGSFGNTLHTEIQYDGFGRVTATIGDNHIGGQETHGVGYDNADKILSESFFHTSNFGGADLVNEYDFDHAGRSNWMTYAVNGAAKQLLSFKYNGKDQLKEKNIHSGGDFTSVLQSVDYGYNNRGWMVYINPVSYSQPQEGLATCGTVATENCFPEIEQEPRCDTKCGETEITLTEFLTIRLQEDDLNLNCYIPCECKKNDCIGEEPDCPPSELLVQQTALGELQSAMSRTTAAGLVYPTTLYRLKLCGGEEPHILQKEMSSMKGSYTVMQELDILSPSQQFAIENRTTRGTQTVDVTGLLSARASGDDIRIEGYVPCDERSAGGSEICDFDENIRAKSIGSSTAFSSYFGHSPYIDLTTAYPGEEASLEDDGNTWYIGRWKTELEAEWDVSYSFGNAQNVAITEYSVSIDIPAVMLRQGVVKIGLHDGTSFVNVNSGQTYLEVGPNSGNAPGIITFTPDVMPSKAQAENMRLAISYDKAFSMFIRVNVVNGHIVYATPCEIECDPPLVCSAAELAAQEASLDAIRGEMEKLTITNLNLPTKLYRVRLCDGSEINLFEHELALLAGNYTILDEIAISSAGQTLLTGALNVDRRDLFMMNLYYHSGNSDLEAPGQKNGNVSHIKWRVAGQSIKAYGFQYDPINRLKKANFAEFFIDTKNHICEMSTGGRYDVYGDDKGETIRYDARGNILNLKRKGVLADCGGGNYDYGEIDNLDYAYYLGSNKLLKLNESASTEKGFQTTPGGSFFLYDENGNTTADPHKGISITYNHLDLPVTITSSEGTISFWYDAGGSKLRTEVVTAGGTTTRDYAGITEYVNGTQEAIYHANGRAFEDANGGYTYQYVLTDHLSNSRISFADLNGNGFIEVGNDNNSYSEIMQEDHYYPFGMGMEGSWKPTVGIENRYQYNGIEREESLGLNVNFATFRTLDPSIGRWWGIDLASEDLYNLTPYNSMANNPVVFVDPDGDFILQAIGAVVGATLNVVNNWDKISANPWSAIGYVATGAAGGAIATVNPALGKAIIAGGNVITDVASGNLPEINGLDDLAMYGAGVAFDAVSTGGSARALGKAVEKSLSKGLLKTGRELGTEVLSLGATQADDLAVYHNGEWVKLWELEDHVYQLTDPVGVTVSAKRLPAPTLNGLGSTAVNASTSLGAHGNSVNSTNPTQVYEHTFQSGKTYTGVGDVDGKRAAASARREAVRHNDPVVSTKKINLPNRKQAYGVEQIRIEMNGGVKSPNNYNRRNSPGLKILKKIFK